ncbi:UNKNOWN [Stylonychia lemnae]|uniref:Uncharacterized protein n=1 Tax=Stylonychia lemnae TaxID=5949 RepID=A0A078AX29_STYLE|nr:UNKNOWN [Stylonychia lemnae]|eukprot:CDW85348.1 UNKNOWN [Stylonychia lemnae]
MDEQEEAFLDKFDGFSTFDILIKLRAEGDPNFKVDFHVNFSTIELIARDNLINLSIQEIRAPYYKRKENDQQIPTLAFTAKYNKLMVNICKSESLNEQNKNLQAELQEKMQKLTACKQGREDRIKRLKMLIFEKQQAIEQKQRQANDIKNNLKKIDKFASDKLSEGKYYQEVFKAFKIKLIDDTKSSQQKFLNSDLCKVIYLQRQTKCLFELFQIFFIPEAMKLYGGIKYFSTNTLLRNKYLDSQKYEIKLSVSLGQIVQLIIHLSVCLGVPAKNPMIFNGHRSIILNSKQEQDYRTIDTGIMLLEANLKRIYRQLDRLKDVYHLNQDRSSNMPSLPFPNNIFALLYKICDLIAIKPNLIHHLNQQKPSMGNQIHKMCTQNFESMVDRSTLRLSKFPQKSRKVLQLPSTQLFNKYEQKFDSLSKFNKRSMRRKHIRVLKIGFLFGTVNEHEVLDNVYEMMMTDQEDTQMGLIGIKMTVVSGSQSVGQQFKIISLKDYNEVQEHSIHLNTMRENELEEEEIISEIAFTYDNQMITQVRLQTSHRQMLISPNDVNYCKIAKSDSSKDVYIVQSDNGIIGFKGSYNKKTGFINRLEIVENQQNLRKLDIFK